MSIHIGAFIAARRRAKGLTQEELANYLGVSKPAVSKWESGQSYPDILLLPVLASYFDTSVDELLGYEAQMSKEDAQQLYLRLSDAFAVQPFESVVAQCREVVRKYRACWHLLFSMAQLYVNHAALADGPAQTADVLREAAALLQSVEQDSGDAKLAANALSLRAYCCLALGEPDAAINLLGDEDARALQPEPLLAKAYILKGEKPRASALLQRFIFHSVIGAFAAVSDLMTLYAGDPGKIEAWLALALKAGETVGLMQVQPHHYFTLYLTAAQLLMSVGESSRALDLLEAFGDVVTDPSVFPLRLKGGELFDKLAAYYDEQNLGAHAPRSDKLIKKDLVRLVLDNPAFSPLKDNARFKRLAERLAQLETTNTSTERT